MEIQNQNVTAFSIGKPLLLRTNKRTVISSIDSTEEEETTNMKT